METEEGLTPDTVLHRAARLTVHVGSANEVRIDTQDGRSVEAGVRALAVLDAFRNPTTLADALEELRTRITGAEEFMGVSATILSLVRHGLLRTDDEAERVMAAERGWANPSIHVWMLNDRARTEAYLAAIGRAVGPDDVVLDLGTGTGVLAVAAAQAGARHVYAVEASGIAGVAQEVFRANGVEGRVTLLRGWSSTLSLPEPATLLVSEIIGHDPLDERVLEHTLDARARLLAPGARLVPRALRVRAYGIRLGPDDEAGYTPSGATTAAWRSWYGIDLGPLGSARGDLPFVTTVRPEQAASWEWTTDPVDLLSVDLATFDELAIESRVRARARSAGPLHGVLLFAEIELDDEVTVSTEPPGPSIARSSWRNVVWLLPEPTEVREGEAVEIVYRYRASGEPEVELEVTR